MGCRRLFLAALTLWASLAWLPSARAEANASQLRSEAVLAIPVSAAQIYPWPLTGQLRRAWLDSTGHVWIVGARGQVARLDWPSACRDKWNPEHWITWNAGDDVDLESVWGHSGKVWAVGSVHKRGTKELERAIVVGFDGKEWRRAYVSDPGRSYRFHDILGFAPNDIYVVGVGAHPLARGRPKGELAPGLTLHFDGADWREVPQGDVHILYRLSGSSADRLYAASHSGQVFRRTQGGWVACPNPGGQAGNVVGLCAWRGRAFAAGTDGMLFEVGERRWIDRSPRRRPGGLLDLAAGLRYVFAPTYEGTVLGWTGRRWTYPFGKTVFKTESSTFTRLYLTSLGGDAVLVTGTNGLVSVLDATGRHDLTYGWKAPPLTAVASAPGRRWCFAVGRKGLALHYDGEVLRELSPPTTGDLSSVWARNDREAIVGSKSAHVFAYNGAGWTRLTRDPLMVEFGRRRRMGPMAVGVVFSPDATTVFVAPASRTGTACLRYDGKQWSALDLPVKPKQIADRTVIGYRTYYPTVGPIWGQAPDDIWICTSEGFLHYDGKKVERREPDDRTKDAFEEGTRSGPYRLSRFGLRRITE